MHRGYCAVCSHAGGCQMPDPAHAELPHQKKKKRASAVPFGAGWGLCSSGAALHSFFLAARASLPLLRPNPAAPAHTFAQVRALWVQAPPHSRAAVKAVSSSIPTESLCYEKNHHRQPQNAIAWDRGTGRSGNGAQLPAWSRAHPAADLSSGSRASAGGQPVLAHVCAKSPCVQNPWQVWALPGLSLQQLGREEPDSEPAVPVPANSTCRMLLWAFVSAARNW